MKQKSKPVAAAPSGLIETSQRSRTVRSITVTAIIFAIAAIPFYYGRYMEINFPDPYDSAAYTYSAQHIIDGAKLGVGEFPTAQPGTLLVNLLGVKLFGFSELGPKLVQTFLQAVALVLMFFTMRKLFGTLAAATGLFIATLFLSAPLIAKFGNVKEQHMIAFMIIGVCTYVLSLRTGKWWLMLIAGAALGWAPMFKQTGMSALMAVAIFVLVLPFLKCRSFKQTGVDILLLIGGFLLGVGPVWIWIIHEGFPAYLPYAWIYNMFAGSDAQGKLGAYVASAREMFGFNKQYPIVLRHYLLLSLPIAIALLSIAVWLVRRVRDITKKQAISKRPAYEPFVILFALWWIFDMALIWVSPRSYEQYFLPLNASAAMLGGYAIAVYRDKVQQSKYQPKWIFWGGAVSLVMVMMAWHVVFGIEVSPFSGQPYGQKSRGYVQRYDEVKQMMRGAIMPWQECGIYIREHTKPNDKIYVWGWYPGIYVTAQRFSPTMTAFESEMHTRSPQALGEVTAGLLKAFQKEPPKFLVDSRKREFPWDRPSLPLWPIGEGGLVQGNAAQIDAFDREYAKALTERFGQEGQRYMAMKPLRDYIMKNYSIVGVFGDQILFELNK